MLLGDQFLFILIVTGNDIWLHGNKYIIYVNTLILRWDHFVNKPLTQRTIKSIYFYFSPIQLYIDNFKQKNKHKIYINLLKLNDLVIL